MTEEEARALCDWAGLSNLEITYAYQPGKENGELISVRRWDNKQIKAGTYLPEDIILYITICDDSYKN